jgi:hypothetical protein
VDRSTIGIVTLELENDSGGLWWTLYRRHGIQKVRGSNPLGSTSQLEIKCARTLAPVSRLWGRCNAHGSGADPFGITSNSVREVVRTFVRMASYLSLAGRRNVVATIWGSRKGRRGGRVREHGRMGGFHTAGEGPWMATEHDREGLGTTAPIDSVDGLEEITSWLGSYRERLRVARAEEGQRLDSEVRRWSSRLSQRRAELA